MNENENVEVVEETTDELTETVEETVEESTQEQGVDYDEELKLRENQREHNKKGYEMRKGINKEAEDQEESNEERTRRIIREELIAARKGEVGDILQDELAKITNPSERKLVEDYYHNTIQKSGASAAAVQRDISMARTLANQPRVKQENQELKLAMKTRNNMSSDGGSTNRQKPKSERKWSKTDMEFFKKHNVTPEEVMANAKKRGINL